MRMIVLMFTLSLSACVSVESVTFWPEAKHQVSSERLASLDIAEVRFATNDNESIYALHLPNPTSKLLTLYFHGNGGNIHQRIGALEKLRSLGSSVLGVSYRGYLNSSGVPTAKGISKDSRAALNYAINTLGYAPADIVVLGRSLGSAVAVDLVQDQKIHAVILVTPFESPRAMLNTQSWFTRLMLKNTNNFLDTAFQTNKTIKTFNAPTLVIHGTADEVVPFGQGKTVYDLLPTKKTFLSLDGAMHSDFGYADDSETDRLYWAAIEALLRRSSQ